MKSKLFRLSIAVSIMACASTAHAHTGQGAAADLMAGLHHPISGVDHVMAMLGVGLLAVALGGRALWCLPATFVGAMGIAGLASVQGLSAPLVEIGIAASVLVVGVAVMVGTRLPLLLAMVLVAGFAVFHGAAHGNEMPADVSGLGYGLGFMLATAALHGAGIALGLGATRFERGAHLLRAAGGALALAGLGLLVGAT
jgi:urease accessory protein